tara:strand:- start:66 stop:431 length:366 start_codon:yes stop_codon:yes gene_type:complete
MAKRKDLTLKKRRHYPDHLVFMTKAIGPESALDGKAHFGDPRPGVRERKSGRNRWEVASEAEVREIKAQMAKDEAEEKARQKKNAEEAKKKPKPTKKKKPKKKKPPTDPHRKGRGLSIKRK